MQKILGKGTIQAKSTVQVKKFDATKTCEFIGQCQNVIMYCRRQISYRELAMLVVRNEKRIIYMIREGPDNPVQVVSRNERDEIIVSNVINTHHNFLQYLK